MQSERPLFVTTYRVPFKGREGSSLVPSSIHSDKKGSLYVADGKRFTVWRLPVRRPGGEALKGGEGEPQLLTGVGVKNVTSLIGLPSVVNACIAVGVSPRGDVYGLDFRRKIMRRLPEDGSIRSLVIHTRGTSLAPFASLLSGGAPVRVAVTTVAHDRDVIYVADPVARIIYRIDHTGQMTVLAGSGRLERLDGKGTEASFICPQAICVDPRGAGVGGGTVYVMDMGCGSAIRRIDPLTRQVTTLAGGQEEGFSDGFGVKAKFNCPRDLCVDQSGYIYVADSLNARIRCVSPCGNVRTLAGDGRIESCDGVATAAAFEGPYALTIDPFGNMWVVDAHPNSPKKWSVRFLPLAARPHPKKEGFLGRGRDDFCVGRLLGDTDLSDMELEVDGHTFPVHRAILAARCDFFRGLFCTALNEKGKRAIEIRDTTPTAMQGVLAFIYTNEYDPRPDEVLDVLMLAHRLMLDKLVDRCVRAMGELLATVATAPHTLPSSISTAALLTSSHSTPPSLTPRRTTGGIFSSCTTVYRSTSGSSTDICVRGRSTTGVVSCDGGPPSSIALQAVSWWVFASKQRDDAAFDELRKQCLGVISDHLPELLEDHEHLMMVFDTQPELKRQLLLKKLLP
ncbi:unnamed protein product [Vitrella brassicaformis CCMP3155]|uniref:BTB domain-containing protein n=2 Tax=Vitrella brassicaformis TaxID=1169539 RepID=A0A0G4FG86_VITBC|nr:unnamed protein product [Vitrella brassicaformis CCMP3155]|eukprot:CEM11843.1 unnamed protein product [Vitrella brassicaformis CCMP3155]